jgi:hypothetical protein
MNVSVDFVTLLQVIALFCFHHFQNPGFDFSSAKLDKQYEDKYIKQMAKETNQEIPPK